MGIKRKVRKASEDLVMAIPAQIARMHDIEQGNWMEISPIGYGEFKIRKIEG